MQVDSVRTARSPRGVRRPGLPALPPGVERYVVPGRSARAIRIVGGDVVRLVNPEGGQACELVCLADDGRLADGLLGERARGSAAGLVRLVADGAARVGHDLAGASSHRSLRAGESRRRGGVVHRDRHRDRHRFRARGGDGGRCTRPADSHRRLRRTRRRRACSRRGGPARTAGGAAPRPAHRSSHRRQLRGARRRVDSDHRRRGAPMHRLPGLPPRGVWTKASSAAST